MKRLTLPLALLCALPAFADPSGHRWELPSCVAMGSTCPDAHTCVNGQCAVNYRIAATVDNAPAANAINGNVDYAEVITAIRNVFLRWTASRVTCPTSWNVSDQGTFTSPVGHAAVNANDKFNNVIFLSGSAWTHMANELALTTTTYTTATNVILDADMELNNNVTWSRSSYGSAYDVDGVVLHEAGHFLGLAHTSSATAVMYAYVNQGAGKRVLTSLDENDVCAVYPATIGAQGTTCTGVNECQTGLVCEAPAGTTAKVCTKDCSSSGDACPTGYECLPSTVGSACLPRITAPDQCHFCQSAGECSTGVCLRLGGSGITFCSKSCTTDDQCGAGYGCEQPAGYCVPTANTCTNQCTTNANCPSKYDCSNGACIPQGNPGDPCQVSLYCDGCNVCVRESETSTNAFCRTCCDSASTTGACDSCANGPCSTDQVCAQLGDATASVCIPGSTTPVTCQTCNNGTCAEGLTCVLGRCRLDCNASSIGSCGACFAVSGDPNYTCACSDEIVGVGQTCGQSGNTLSACGPGTLCVQTGTSNVCRALCNANVPNSCPGGFTCQLTAGLGVCMPGTEGSACANCTNTQSCNAGLTCYLGRCYEPCNINTAGTCATCVATQGSGVGVCACEDQIAAENEPCGVAPELHGCATGTACVNGTCRAPCNPQSSSCPIGTSCQSIGGLYYCNNIVSTGGGGGSARGGGGGSSSRGGGSAAGGGTGGGTSMDLGCGCGAAGGPWGAALFAVFALLRRRRRA